MENTQLIPPTPPRNPIQAPPLPPPSPPVKSPTPPRNPILPTPPMTHSLDAPPPPPPVKSPGYGFNPTDQELVEDFLRKKVMGEDLGRCCEIMQKDLYAEEPPWQICGGKTQAYFFTVLKKKGKKGGRIDRRCSKAGASWKKEGHKQTVKISGDEVVGYKDTLSYVDGKLGERLASPDGHNWLMHKYSLASYPDEAPEYVLCRLKRGRRASVKNKPPESALHEEVSNSYAAADGFVSSPSPPIEEGQGPASPEAEHHPRGWSKFKASLYDTVKGLFA